MRISPRPFLFRDHDALALILSVSANACSEADDATASPGAVDDEPASSSVGHPQDAAAGSSTGERGAADSTDGGAHGGAGGAGETEAPSEMPEAIPPGPWFEAIPLNAPHVAVSNTWGPGQAWADVDGDGRLDLFAVGGDGPSHLLLNDGAGGFVAWSDEAGVFAPDRTVGVAIADYDDDGFRDVLLVRDAANILLRNDNGVGFIDVTQSAGVGDEGHGISAAWADYDQDGKLDLFVANAENDPDALFHNEGDGVFSDARPLLPAPPVQAFAGVWFDYDDDGRLDLYVANDKFAGNRLWRNTGPAGTWWSFVDVASTTDAVAPAEAMGIDVADYDLDGDLDITFSDNKKHRLLRNDVSETGTFTDVSVTAGVDYDAIGWGVVFLDFDNDGDPDLHVADLGPTNRLFENLGDGTFADVTDDCGCPENPYTYGAAMADYDEDGAVDFAIGNRGSGHRVYRNRRLHPERHWITVRLEGGGDVNRDAIGARVTIITTAGRTLVQEVKCGSSFASQSMTDLHFGLGDESIEELVIRWPNGQYEKPSVPEVDQVWVHAVNG